jgi:hypothetical protein
MLLLFYKMFPDIRKNIFWEGSQALPVFVCGQQRVNGVEYVTLAE